MAPFGKEFWSCDLEEEGASGIIGASRAVAGRSGKRQRRASADGPQLAPVQHQHRLRPLRQAPWAVTKIQLICGYIYCKSLQIWCV